MKLLIQRKPLLESLDLVKEAIAKHAPLPILKDVKISADEESLALYTTNLNIGIKAIISDVSIIEPGTALCDAQKFLSILKELPNDEVILTKEDNGHVRIECDKSTFKLLGLSEEDFPNEMTPPNGDGFATGDDLFRAISKVRHAASKDESRYNLNGVYFDKEIVATDGHRLSMVKTDHELKDAIVPIEFINIIMRLRRNGNKNYKLSRSENFIFICSDDITLHCRLIDGAFPDYAQVIPQTFERTATMDRLKLYHAIKRITLMSDKSNQIRFEFNTDRVLLTSANPDEGEACEELEAQYKSESTEESPFAIGFAGKYILDVLEVLEGEQVTFLMSAPEQPMQYRKATPLTSSCRYGYSKPTESEARKEA